MVNNEGALQAKSGDMSTQAHSLLKKLSQLTIYGYSFIVLSDLTIYEKGEMGRRKLTQERTGEILEAFARCLLKYGLDTSLEQVAEEAGMTRSIIRHYIGNREEVVNMLLARIADDYLTALQEAEREIPQEAMIAATLDYLFSGQPGFDLYDKLIFDVMMTAKELYPQGKARLRKLFDDLIELFAADLKAAYPHAPKEECCNVAYSIIALSQSNDSFLWLGLNPAYNRAARTSAEALIQMLSQSIPQ
jgi:AcrR family transcriptional regulator